MHTQASQKRRIDQANQPLNRDFKEDHRKKHLISIRDKRTVPLSRGIIAGMYAGSRAGGDELYNFLVGAITALITASASYAGANIDVATTSAVATAFANYAVSLVTATLAELSNLGIMELLEYVYKLFD